MDYNNRKIIEERKLSQAFKNKPLDPYVLYRGTLSKVASHLYHTDPSNNVRQEIYRFLESYGEHPKTEITTPISDSIKKEVELYLESKRIQKEANERELRKLKKK